MTSPVAQAGVVLQGVDGFTPVLRAFQEGLSRTAQSSGTYNQQLKLMAQGVDQVAARMSSAVSGQGKWEEGLRRLGQTQQGVASGI